MTETTPMVTVRDVEIRRRGHAILSVQHWQAPLCGGITALIGPNGAGKTTLLRLMHGLIEPDAGRVHWPGDGPPRRAILLQAPVLLRRTTAANLEFVLRKSGVERADRPAWISALLDSAGLSAQANHPARRLSGGQQRRLALAQALAQQPDMLLLDEPTAGLDPSAASAVDQMIARTASTGTAVLLSSHDLGQVRRLASHAAFLHRGSVVADGPLPDLFDDPPVDALTAYLKGNLTW